MRLFLRKKKSREKASRRIAESDGEKAKKYHPLKSWKQRQQQRKRKNQSQIQKDGEVGRDKARSVEMTTMVHKKQILRPKVAAP
jgi:hypothetical protein